jgi:hypothetical protein
VWYHTCGGSDRLGERVDPGQDLGTEPGNEAFGGQRTTLMLNDPVPNVP